MNIVRVKRKVITLLDRVEQDGAYLNILLQKEANGGDLAPEEYPILVQLVRGILENRHTIDAALEPLLDRGLQSLPPPVRQVLRLGAYQILMLDRVKKKDAVFEAVELLKRTPFRKLGGVVNAVLRKIEPPDRASPVEESGGPATGGYPEWMISRWRMQFGDQETDSFCRANNQTLPVYFRINTARINRQRLITELAEEGVLTECLEFVPNALRVLELPRDKRIHQLGSFLRGEFFIQDLSSTIVSMIATSERPKAVLDLCAAPGGKSFSMALLMQSQVENPDLPGSVRALDRAEKRAGLIREGCERLGLMNVQVATRDGLEPLDDLGLFDAVLVDAPCSGFGTMGRKIDGRWSRSEIDLQQLVDTQLRLICNASQVVKPGGYLVYSTCTIDCAENEELVQQFLARTPQFSIASVAEIVPPGMTTPNEFFRAWPQHHAMAGAFAARMLRTR